ncbi:MAG: acyl-CoA dehydrogenase family protein [Deltaproteobacteria bacterium]|nr:acyl-CoA dehydrogenase family protein [Deltaproteobacteria bacterium]
MQFEPTPEQLLVRDMARDFARREIAPVAAALDRESRFPTEILARLADIGMMGVNVREEFGGAQAGPVAYVLALTEIAAACASTAVTMSVTNMVAEVIQQFGTDEQRHRHIPKITSGEYAAGAFGLSEPGAGSDPGSMTTTARRDGDGWVLNGEKAWITSGDRAGVIVVWARTGGPGTAGLSAFLVEPGTPGFEVGRHEDKMGLRASSTVSLHFDSCRLPAGALLGDEGRGFRIAMMALDGGRLGISSQGLGIARAALEEATAYARDRRQFGRPIAEFQAIQWMLADCAAEWDAAWLLLLRAAWLKEQGRPFSREASMAKVYATERANAICARCFQVHGGYGYVKEYPIERHLRDARVTTIYEGTSEVQRVVISRATLK